MDDVSEFQLAEEVGSISTCPHRESELAARVAEHPSQSVYVHRILSSRQRGDYAQPPLSVSLQNLSVAEFAPATRFVLSPSPTLAGSLSKELDLTPLRCKGILGDIYTVAQSSKEAWFNFNSPHLSFRLYYDPASDNLVFMNLGKSLLRLDSMKTDHTRDDSKGYLVLPRQPTQITPGLWRVSFRENKGAPRMDLCDFLLLRRRYCVEISRSTQETGSKRRLAMPDAQRKKRHLDDDDRSLVLINVTPIVSLLSYYYDCSMLTTYQRKGRRTLGLQSPEMGIPFKISSRDSVWRSCRATNRPAKQTAASLIQPEPKYRSNIQYRICETLSTQRLLQYFTGGTRYTV